MKPGSFFLLQCNQKKAMTTKLTTLYDGWALYFKKPIKVFRDYLMSLKNIGYFCAVRPYYVIGFWILLVVISGVLSQTYLEDALKGGQGPTKDLEFALASKLKEKKLTLLNQRLGQSTGQVGEGNSDEENESILVVTSDKYSFPSDEYLNSLNGFLAEIQREIDNNKDIDRDVGTIQDYSINPSPDASTVMIPAPFLQPELLQSLVHLSEEYSNADFGYYFVGLPALELAFQELAEKDLLTGETIGISVAIIILALVFGSVVSAVIPVILAVVSIFISVGLTTIIGQFVDLNDFVPNIMTMMGLAVGIDYCLFILSRYREERESGLDKVAAIVRTNASAGRAVLFSGLTVVLALLGMFVIPEKTFQAFGVGAILVVFVAVMAGITLLPSIVGVLGDKVNQIYVHKKITIVIYMVGFLVIALTQSVGPKLLIASGAAMGVLVVLAISRTAGLNFKFLSTEGKTDASEGGFWNAITVQVMKWPVVSMLFVTGLLLLLGYFYFDLEKGTSGISVLPDDQSAKIGFMVLDEKYGFGSNEPASIVIDADIRSEEIAVAVETLKSQLEQDSGFVDPMVNLYPEVAFVEITAKLSGDPQDQLALDSIRRLRSELIPRAFSDIKANEYQLYVGGSTAEVVDSVEMTDEYFPLVLGMVLALSFLLLLFAFRSITISIISILMNLLSVAASYGLLVLVFQNGFLIDLFGFEQVDQLEFWLPLFMFSILFGLSMDYHVFMLSRIKENFDETGSPSESVAFGLRRTASIITGAALIMVAVFGGFALGEITFFQSMGFGLGAAVLIDATVVRSILVPSVMKLLGSSAWYLPKWLEWLPNISIEGESRNK